MTAEFPPSMTLKVIEHGVNFTWESQRDQYPATGSPGIAYRAERTVYGTVDCLLFYDENGTLRGILNHYPFDAITPEGLELERVGNFNVYVDPQHRRQGIASRLLDEARNRWALDIEQQTYSPDGVRFIVGYLNSRSQGS